MSNDTLLAIPFFTFMGLILERSGMAEDLLDTIGQLFGPIRGGLAYAVIFVGALLAATTGVVAASVISMGLISLPIMLRYGYDRRLASGVIAASGTLAQIIPPSLVLIVMADQLGRSVGDMYAGAFIPGLVARRRCTWLYVLGRRRSSSRHGRRRCRWRRARLRAQRSAACTSSLVVLLSSSPCWSPCALCYVLPRIAERRSTRTLVVLDVASASASRSSSRCSTRSSSSACCRSMAERVIFVLIPPLALIFLVLGTIFLGVATPTEGGAMGAVGALIMALRASAACRWTLMRQAMDTTAKLSSFVVFILIGARVFQPDVLRRQRPRVGRAPADSACPAASSAS